MTTRKTQTQPQRTAGHAKVMRLDLTGEAPDIRVCVTDKGLPRFFALKVLEAGVLLEVQIAANNCGVFAWTGHVSPDGFTLHIDDAVHVDADLKPLAASAT